MQYFVLHVVSKMEKVTGWTMGCREMTFLQACAVLIHFRACPNLADTSGPIKKAHMYRNSKAHPAIPSNFTWLTLCFLSFTLYLRFELCPSEQKPQTRLYMHYLFSVNTFWCFGMAKMSYSLSNIKSIIQVNRNCDILFNTIIQSF